jgi:hypothetical protein
MEGQGEELPVPGVTVRWTMEASLRLHGLAPGPCTPNLVKYFLGDGRLADVPLSLPLGPPASRGCSVITLPAPPGGGDIEHAGLYAEDGTEIMTLTCVPPLNVDDGDTWQVPVEAPA